MKKVLKSKTVAINVIVAVGAILALFTPMLDVYVADPEVKATIAETIILIQGILNVVLRVFFTKEPLEVLKKD